MDLSQLPYKLPTRDAYNAAFLASLPKPYRDVLAMDLADMVNRVNAAVTLARGGMVIDVDMIYGADPYGLQWQRIFVDEMVDPTTGKGWAAALLGPEILVSPGNTFPGLPSYDPSKPPNPHVLVSLDINDYPSIDAPVTPAPPAAFQLVGDDLGFQEPYTFPTDWLTSDGKLVKAGTIGNLEVYRNMTTDPLQEALHYTRPSDGLKFVYHYLGGNPLGGKIGVWLRLP